jgi:predicted nucleotidyltransferase
MAFSTQQELMIELRRVKQQLQAHWPIQQLWLFGSWVRGEATPTSDVDLLVQLDPELSKEMGLFAFFDLIRAFEGALGCPVDLVEKDALKPRLAQSVLTEAVEV